jgi:hypothetical protein
MSWLGMSARTPTPTTSKTWRGAVDNRLDILVGLWPIFAGFISLVIVLAKMHADQETMKEKIRTLFTLWNSRDKD